MSRFSRTWWGQRFIDALERFTDPGRLARGRSYASDKRIKSWDLSDGKVSTKIRGNVNHYFGVYKEPTYRVTVKMTAISKAHWKKVIQWISLKASFISKLMTNEMPDTIEHVFADLGTHLLPIDYQDFKVKCSCPDVVVPCKHIAGTCYRLASHFDQDPFLLFEMRGLKRKILHQELAKTRLGQILSASLTLEEPVPTPANSYYTRPKLKTSPKTVDPKAFWNGEKPLNNEIEPVKSAAVSAVLIKQGGDYPPFWDKQSSFIDVMEEFYQRVRKQSKHWL